ncbi:sensor domain-containing diguanylate cyclase [Macromonas nakdongensis]|uniref:sensor domain-containing diguanylate cyclase n=1 Tax=Macromonas nakdongensis TaxID=1843082 RepID=UPI001E646217|nr:sensor domain-containing diguanylate cyclase [Macromonas nakdongensis]
MNHRNRTASWAMGCGVVGLHLHSLNPPTWAWWALVGQFLVYPHLVYLWAKRARHPLQAEIINMRLDAFCFGMWAASLGFPLWITFLFGIGTCINLAAFEGRQGLLEATGALLLGVLVALPWTGLRFAPDSSLPVALLSIVTLSTYLILYSLGAHTRTLKLHQARQRLKENEVALQNQLAEIRLLQTQLREEVDRDPLTGLYNRRYLAATIDRELARCLRDGTPLCVMMLDIDHFKRINDRHGHPLGDRVLVAVAETLSTTLRAGDIACRYGGEEFLLLLPNVSPDTARERAEELRSRVAQLRLSCDGEAIEVRISIGLACTSDRAVHATTLVQQADQALYQAKALGRDRVETGA